MENTYVQIRNWNNNSHGLRRRSCRLPPATLLLRRRNRVLRWKLVLPWKF